MDVKSLEKRSEFLKQEIAKYKEDIDATRAFLADAEAELDDITALIIEEEEKQAKAEAKAQAAKTKPAEPDFAKAKDARDAFAILGEKLFAKPTMKKRMEFGIIHDGNGGVVYTYGNETPLIEKIVSILSDKLPDEIF